MKIKSIKKIGKRKVYDIIMLKNHNFLLSNNILSSNSECKGLIDGQQEILAICEMPSPNSIETTCVPLKKAGRMNSAQIQYIQWRIQKHQVCIVQRGKRAVILKRINPPRSMYWKPEYRNFTTFWKKEKDKWVNSKTFLDIIKNENQKRLEYLSIIHASENEEIEPSIEVSSNEEAIEDIEAIEDNEEQDDMDDINEEVIDINDEVIESQNEINNGQKNDKDWFSKSEFE